MTHFRVKIFAEVGGFWRSFVKILQKVTPILQKILLQKVGLFCKENNFCKRGLQRKFSGRI
ncbi:hypothetical protein AKJ37_06580 [candidate division MSBL1 archaeon SCGC-AAA259I09]|uniref:Uncharacterized protein n=2 Tax=candidate division MSBL1 TaxID=215777 RepID=A0A133UNP5_9EURY|nr:hypothetical protein AKJ61_03630 [candidate division MSBL1 archaeon SCGC-AAA259B11]KXA95786.1 hypothetical protein AKJ37_06580 [candidate division MSBL1 archaeon SCGC-AAA259I09]